MNPPARRFPCQAAATALAVLAVLAIAGCKGAAPLPDANSPAARLYVSRCGQCHRLYNPHEMTAAMWQLQMAAMEGRIRDAGLPPLSDAEHATILTYLKRNAGTE
ncbi:MAG: hypothetical protein ACREQI_11450 [Candidatus Binataceae bacterium]